VSGHSHREPDFDPDEDLFDFAGAETDGDPVEESELYDPLDDFEAPLPPPRHAGPHVAPVLHLAEAPPAAPAPGQTLRTAWQGAAAEPATGVPAAGRSGQRRFSRGAVAIALASAVINSLVAVVLLHSRPPEPFPLARPGPNARPTPVPAPRTQAPPAHTDTGPAWSLPDPESARPVDDHPTLDVARREIERGDYAASRRTAYGLLAVIDALEEPRRTAVEGQCRELIARSLHLEALAQAEPPR